MPRREVRCDFTDSEPEDSTVDPFAKQQEKEFNLPSPHGLTDEEEPSPSQYRAERVREDAADPFEEEKEEGPKDLVKSDEEDIDSTEPPFANTGSLKVPCAGAVYSKFINMGKFVVEMEDRCKQELIM
jgi:hypothetical protein